MRPDGFKNPYKHVKESRVMDMYEGIESLQYYTFEAGADEYERAITKFPLAHLPKTEEFKTVSFRVKGEACYIVSIPDDEEVE